MTLHDPVFRLVIFDVHPFGLFVALGIVAGYIVALWRALRAGLPARYLPSMLIVVVLGGLVAARLEYVAFHPETLRGGLQDVLSLWRGGLTLLGGVLGGAILLALYCWARRERFWPWADALAPAASLGLAIGMLGLPYTGEGWGQPTRGPFFMSVPTAELPASLINATRFQPIFAYEAILFAALTVLLTVLSVRQRRAGRAPGAVALTFLLLTVLVYGALRPLTLDAPNGVLVLQTQVICAAAAAYALGVLLVRTWRSRAEAAFTREIQQARVVVRRG